MLTIKYHKSFKKDYKLIVKRGYNISLLEEVIGMLAMKKLFPKSIVTTTSEANTRDSESATFSPIGC